MCGQYSLVLEFITTFCSKNILYLIYLKYLILNHSNKNSDTYKRNNFLDFYKNSGRIANELNILKMMKKTRNCYLVI